MVSRDFQMDGGRRAYVETLGHGDPPQYVVVALADDSESGVIVNVGVLRGHPLFGLQFDDMVKLCGRERRITADDGHVFGFDERWWFSWLIDDTDPPTGFWLHREALAFVFYLPEIEKAQDSETPAVPAPKSPAGAVR